MNLIDTIVYAGRLKDKDNLSYLQRQAQWLEITYSLCESQRVRETA